MSIADQIKRLTKNEITVLAYKCKGLKYEQIKDRTGYSLGWVQLQMIGVYTKLGFSKEMHWTKRRDILENEVCPLIPKNLDDWEPVKTIREKTKEEYVVEEITEGTTVEETETKADSEMMELVLYDEKMLAEANERNEKKGDKKKETEIIEIPTKLPRGSCLPRVLMGILAFILLIGVAYGAYVYGRNSVAQVTPEVQVITATFPPTPLESSTPTFTETSPPTITLTAEPTFTPLPTATQFIPPADGILFQDDFSSGDLSAWTQYGGNWIIANNQLSIVGEDTDSYRWIALNRPAWKNYILSLKVNIPFQGSAAQSDIAIAVRNEGSQSAYLAVHIDTIRNRPYWAFVEGTNEDSVAGLNEGTYFESGSTMELVVDGNTYTLRVNGREIQKITISGYNSGGISLGIYCYIEMGCPSFDNVKITYLP